MKPMKMIIQSLMTLLIMFSPALLRAACGATAYYATTADGRPSTDHYVAASGEIIVYALVASGHSYSAEVTDPFDPLGGSGTYFFNLIVGGGTCSDDTADVGGFRDSTSADPANYGGRRVSFVPPSPELIYAIIKNTDSGGHYYHVRFVDTTLFSPGWSTFAIANTYWSFTNTSSSATDVYLHLMDTTGTEVTTTTRVTINPGGTFSTNTVDLAAPRNRNGSVMVSHNGPPGTIVATAVIYSGSTNPQYVPFGPRPQ